MDSHLPHCTVCLTPLASGWLCPEHIECNHWACSKHLNDGNIYCKLCGWVYRIGLTGSRWVAPDFQPLELVEVL